MRFFALLSFCVLMLAGSAQQPADVLHYRFRIVVNDHNDSIYGHALITFLPPKDKKVVAFDLAAVSPEGKGMKLIAADIVNYADTDRSWQAEDKVFIELPPLNSKNDTLQAWISYRGIPADGLIISRSKYGKRTFFSDNWPDRAHQWIPCVDDPADKATVEFVVTAPAHYRIVSNGDLVSDTIMPGANRLSHWVEKQPLPTKIMVIGIADFAVDTVGTVTGVPVTSWVFPENRTDGFYDYAQAKEVLEWFVGYMGPFPFSKLANIQSKTIFGGMENAGAIFYNQDYVTGDRSHERLFAHEITHQWFGDMVTEKNFSHLWLSEGFATCLANMYLEAKHGKKRMVDELIEDRNQVIDFANGSSQPVVDTVSAYMQLLNANSYQKGGWVLHMLRRELGDSVFHTIVLTFYKKFAGKNADTRDFQKVCENVSGKNLSTFFHQWLYEPGYPSLEIQWKYLAASREIQVTVSQSQANIFEFPLELGIQLKNSDTVIKKIRVTKRSQTFSLPVDAEARGIIPDPNTSLLFGMKFPPKKL